ncbi:MAG: hypothetical protein SF162_17690 [bacterium]|nr:hypothetical protein [bacterium]
MSKLTAIHSGTRWIVYGFLVLITFGFAFTRFSALDALPLHNDEGLHLTRAVEVWNLHPFWEIGDGKIVNHWLIALFYPHNAPAFTGRAATAFVSLIGLAAGLAVGRQIAGLPGLTAVGILWISNPYLHFFERLAFSDAQAGALLVVSVYTALRLVRTGKRRDLVFTGLALAGAALFKVSAAPFALTIAALLLFGNRQPVRVRIFRIAAIALIVMVCFAPPVLYLLVRGRGLFTITYQWLRSGGDAGSTTTGIAENLHMLGEQLTGYGLPMWAAALIGGLGLLLVLRSRQALSLWMGWLVPLAIIIVLGNEVQARHYVVALPLAVVLAGAGWGVVANNRRSQPPVRAALATAGVALIVLFIPGLIVSANAPEMLDLPGSVRTQHITEHPAGYGLREAVLSFPQTLTDSRPVVASMFPDSCRRANFYAAQGRIMQCTDAPGFAMIRAVLAESGSVYVLTETPGLIGVDLPADAAAWGATAQQIAAYPRPGEQSSNASVQLWLLTRP